MTKTDPKPRPRVAILRGPFLNSFEMQTYELLKGEFDITAFTPHQTYFDTSGIDLPQESLWCPIAGKTPFEREKRKWQALRDRLTGRTHSFCGLRDRLEGFDLYHIMDQYFCFSYEAALAKRRHGGKLVVTQYENIPFLNDHKAMERQIKRSVREQADLFLAMSGGAREVLLQEGVPEPKIEPFSGAVDTKRFCPGARDRALARELGLTGASFTLLYVGRLAKSKGVFTLLKAAEVLAREDAGFRLLLVGKDEEGVGDWVAQRGLERCVRLAGFVAYPQMPRYYRLADAFVLPSL
ncbi:MAG TPA: glycosyltransferase, partial [bacterium]|nr:glycosyltransferase [bacterium]